jgi:hypothetical protein
MAVYVASSTALSYWARHDLWNECESEKQLLLIQLAFINKLFGIGVVTHHCILPLFKNINDTIETYNKASRDIVNDAV